SAGIEVRQDLAPGLPHVWADADQISQVLTNLIVNAQQALADWAGRRRLTVRTETGADGRVRLSVSDSGPGVPIASRSRLFEPFFTTKPIGMGTGIGLSVCHSIITSYGGTIAVEDAPGGGSTFVVMLPVGGADAIEGRPTAGQPSASAQSRVLIVD